MIKRLAMTAVILLAAAPAFAARYVSLCPATTEIIFALGAGSELCGVSRYCDYPPEAAYKEKIGDFSQPNIEKIVSLKPDVVFCTGLEQTPSITSLRKLGLAVCVSDPKNLSELYSSILEIGRLTNRVEKARTIVASMKQAVEQARQKAAAAEKRPKVFFEVWHDPLMAAGNGSFIDELIAIAGGSNVCADTPRPYCRVSEEVVVQADPDVIVALSSIKTDKIYSRFGWEGLKAVKGKKVYNDIDENILCRPTPRLVEGLSQLQERILK
ncbi:MAG: cobalamin-binding protein [Deltaproteobacteria bacterium]